MDTKAAASQYRHLLTDNVLQWWLDHAIDQEQGGLFSCIADDGKILSEDKYVWSQVRALWTFAAAYRRIDANPAYLKTADQLFNFCKNHGRTEAGDWAFRVSRNGQDILDGADSIQTDAYAICSMVEYALATGRDEPMQIARDGYAIALAKLNKPGSYNTRPYPIPAGSKAQRVSMQFSLAFHDLAKATDDMAVRHEAMKLTDDVLDHFRRPELKATLEYLTLDNQLMPPPLGTYVSPGHGIETAWFQLENLRNQPQAITQDPKTPQRISQCLDMLKWGLEAGWDPQYGGLLYAVDLHGGKSAMDHADAKIWWPHCEAICATALGYEFSSDPYFLKWHEKIMGWCLAHFSVKDHGEWTQRLDRTGLQRMDKVVALPVKDPFHLPRGLVYAIESFERVNQ